MTATAPAIRQAISAYNAGDFPRARRAAEQLLATRPDDLDALQIAGLASCQSGDPKRGAAYLLRAVKAGDGSPETRVNLARAFLDAGDIDAAARICASADLPQLRQLEADIAKSRGDVTGAITLYERSVRLAPKSFEGWNNLGNARHEAGDVEGALLALRRARDLAPGVAIVHLNIGRACVTAGRLEEALAAFRESMRLAPADGQALFEAGKALFRMNRPEEALASLGSAARLLRDNPSVFVVIGLTFAALADLAKAEQAYRMALQVDDTHAPAYLNLAILLERGNRIEELDALTASACNGAAQGPEADWIRAMTLRRQGRLQEALDLALAVEPPSLAQALRAQFIGEVADRIGDVDIAYRNFSEMNRIMASYPDAARFDGTERSRQIVAMTETLTENWARSWTNAGPIAGERSPAFLVGFLRSGTTLLDTMLMGHPDTTVMEEEPILAEIEDHIGNRQDLALLNEKTIRELRLRYFDTARKVVDHPPERLLIDKNPLGTLRAPLIHRLFPEATFIFALRHPCDVVLSCWMQNFQVTEAMASFLDLENAARLYAAAMGYWERARSILPLNVVTVRYEDLVVDPEREMHPMLDRLNLRWEHSILDHQRTARDRGYIRTPSYAQVSEGLYARASGRWTRYREHMAPALPILRPWIEKFGYAAD